MRTFLVRAHGERGARLIATRRVRITKIETGRIGVTVEKSAAGADTNLYFTLVREVRTVTEIKDLRTKTWDATDGITLEPLTGPKPHKYNFEVPDRLAQLLLPAFVELATVGTVDEELLGKALMTYLATIDGEFYQVVKAFDPNLIWMPDAILEKARHCGPLAQR